MITGIGSAAISAAVSGSSGDAGFSAGLAEAGDTAAAGEVAMGDVAQEHSASAKAAAKASEGAAARADL
jgi:hypothetical protein